MFVKKENTYKYQKKTYCFCFWSQFHYCIQVTLSLFKWRPPPPQPHTYRLVRYRWSSTFHMRCVLCIFLPLYTTNTGVTTCPYIFYFFLVRHCTVHSLSVSSNLWKIVTFVPAMPPCFFIHLTLPPPQQRKLAIFCLPPLENGGNTTHVCCVGNNIASSIRTTSYSSTP